MAKKLINLLIEAQPETAGIRQLKKFTPIVSGVILGLFLLLHLISLIYLKFNLNEYNKVNEQVATLEKKISSSKSSESLYLTTISVLDKIKSILAKESKIVNNTVPVLLDLQNSEIKINTILVDNKGPVSFSVKSTSSYAMISFIEKLKQSEALYNFNNVKANGIIRENDGSYIFSVSLKVIPKKTNEKLQ